jgi:hypothetical protein
MCTEVWRSEILTNCRSCGWTSNKNPHLNPRWAWWQDFHENFQFFTSIVQKTAEFCVDSFSYCTMITMRQFPVKKLREIIVFNTNFHRENSHDFPSFLVLFQSCVDCTAGWNGFRGTGSWREIEGVKWVERELDSNKIQLRIHRNNSNAIMLLILDLHLHNS